VFFSLFYLLTCRVLALVLLRFRTDRSKDIEIVVLRHELAVLHRQIARPELKDIDRVFLAAASRFLPALGGRCSLFGPRPSFDGIAAWPRVTGPTRGEVQDVHRLPPT